jgi:hypothetical protein
MPTAAAGSRPIRKPLPPVSSIFLRPATWSASQALPPPPWSKASSAHESAVGAIAREPPKSFPYGICAVPEITTCGLTEEELKERKIPYECGVARLRETSRGHIMGPDTRLVKMILSLKTACFAFTSSGKAELETYWTGRAEPQRHRRVFRAKTPPTIRPLLRPARSPASTRGTGFAISSPSVEGWTGDRRAAGWSCE